MTVHEAYREGQVELLREMLKTTQDEVETLKTHLALALDRAEKAENLNRILREELLDAGKTPFDE